MIDMIVIRFVNVWHPTMCMYTECTFNMVCELADDGSMSRNMLPVS